MRVLMITQLFHPEPNHLKGLSFAKELVRQGHEVEVLTGYPNYPGGKIYHGYRQHFYQRETIEGVTIFRVPLYPDHSNSGFRRILCYLSLALSACIPGLLLVHRPDVVHVYQGPATLAFPAILLRLLWNVPYVLDVQDLWPESVTSSGMLRFPWSKFALSMWCKLTNCLARKIVVLSPGYKEKLLARKVSTDKIEIVYNWCDESQEIKQTGEVKVEDRFGLDDYFSVVYAGNLGRVQALDAVLDAASLLRNDCPKILFVFVGDGIDEGRLKDIAAFKGLDNVRFISRQPVSEIGGILERAGALLIHLRDDPLCRVGIPQKTQAYLASGRPIIIAVKGDAANLVADANAGINCEPENPVSIAEAAKKLYDMPTEAREQMGHNGAVYYKRHLAFDVGVQRMNSILTGATQ